VSPSRICNTMHGSENVNILFVFEFVKRVSLQVLESRILATDLQNVEFFRASRIFYCTVEKACVEFPLA
jgi:hypothetical protein